MDQIKESKQSLEEYATEIVAKTAKLIGEKVYNDKGLPIGETFTGKHKTSPLLTVGINKYYVKGRSFTSLSAAAKFIMGREMNGWTFWVNLKNETVDHVYRKNNSINKAEKQRPLIFFLT